MLRVDHCVTFFEFHALASLDLTPKGYGDSHRYPLSIRIIVFQNGALGRNRTYDLRIRSPLLYPTELQGHEYRSKSTAPPCLDYET